MTMSTYTLLLLIITGLVTGAFAGMMGLGGGLILIPALVFIFGFSQQQANGTSLAVMLPPIGLFAAYNYYKAGHVNLKYALILAAAFMIGSYFTSAWATKIPEATLRRIFSIFLFLVAIRMFFSKNGKPYRFFNRIRVSDHAGSSTGKAFPTAISVVTG